MFVCLTQGRTFLCGHIFILWSSGTHFLYDHIYIDTFLFTHGLAHMHTRMRMHTHTDTHAHAYTYKQNIYAHTHKCMHACMHARTHTHAHVCNLDTFFVHFIHPHHLPCVFRSGLVPSEAMEIAWWSRLWQRLGYCGTCLQQTHKEHEDQPRQLVLAACAANNRRSSSSCRFWPHSFPKRWP